MNLAHKIMMEETRETALQRTIGLPDANYVIQCNNATMQPRCQGDFGSSCLYDVYCFALDLEN
jgi:hypothetical protein